MYTLHLTEENTTADIAYSDSQLLLTVNNFFGETFPEGNWYTVISVVLDTYVKDKANDMSLPNSHNMCEYCNDRRMFSEEKPFGTVY